MFWNSIKKGETIHIYNIKAKVYVFLMLNEFLWDLDNFWYDRDGFLSLKLVFETSNIFTLNFLSNINVSDGNKAILDSINYNDVLEVFNILVSHCL